MPHYKLIYFTFGGLGEHIRFMFHVAGVPFEDETMDFFEDWPKVKANSKYGQLPILQVDGKELSQSLSIARYLAKEFNLEAKDPFLNAKADEIVDFATELRLEFRKYNRKIFDGAKREVMKKNFVENISPKYYKWMEDLVAETEGDFCTGNTAVWQDFFLAVWLQVWSEQGGPDLNGFPALKKLQEAVFAIPAIKKRLDMDVPFMLDVKHVIQWKPE